MPSAAEFQAQVDKASTNLQRLDGVVNGGPTVVVETDNGPVKSLANVINGIQDDVYIVADAIEDVTAVAGVVGQIPTVAGLADELTAVAPIASQVVTVAGLETEILGVPGQVEAAETARTAAELAAATAAAAQAIYPSVTTASATTIPVGVKALQTQYRDPTYSDLATLVGGGFYARVSKAAIDAAGYPAAAYFRSSDRFMPDGSTDATNGGYWLLSGNVINAEALGVGAGGDDAQRLEDALIFADGRRLVVNQGTNIVLLTNVTYDGDTVDLEFKPGAVLTPTSGRILFQPPLAALPALAADIDPNDNVISFTSAHGLAVGEVWGPYNPTDESWSEARTSYREGAMYKVAAVPSSTSVRLYGIAEYAAVASTFTCHKMTGKKCHIRGLATANTGVNIPVWIDGFQDVLLDDFDFSAAAAAETQVEVFRCFNVHVGRGKSVTISGDSYPIAIANCYNVMSVATIGQYSTRHNISLGGRTGDLAVPTTNVQYIGGVAANDQNLAIGAVDSHGGCRRVSFSHMTVNLANVGGQDVEFNHCLILGRPADGCAVFSSEPRGGHFTFNHCRFVSETAGGSFGMLHFAFPDGILADDLVINLNNPVWDIRADAASARLIWLAFSSGVLPTKTITVNVTRPQVLANAAPFAMYAISSGASDDLTNILTINQYDRVEGTQTDSLVIGSNIANHACIRKYPQQLDLVTVRGDTSPTLTLASSTLTQVFDTPLTATRTVTLPSSTYATAVGTRFRIVRTAASTGAFGLDVGPGPLKTLNAGEWCEVQYTGSAWFLTAFGSL